MSGPLGNQLAFPRVLMFRVRKRQDSQKNKANCFPRDLTLSV